MPQEDDCCRRCCVALVVIALIISAFWIINLEDPKRRRNVNELANVDDRMGNVRRKVETVEQSINSKIRELVQEMGELKYIQRDELVKLRAEVDSKGDEIEALKNAQRKELDLLRQEVESANKNPSQSKSIGHSEADVHGKAIESMKENLALLKNEVSQNSTKTQSMFFHLYGRAQMASNQCRKDNWRISARQRIIEREIKAKSKVEIPDALKTRLNQLDENIAMKPSSKDIDMLKTKLQKMDEILKTRLQQMDDRVRSVENGLICVAVLLVIAVVVVVLVGVWYTKRQFSFSQRPKYHQV